MSQKRDDTGRAVRWRALVSGSLAAIFWLFAGVASGVAGIVASASSVLVAWLG